MSSTTFANSPVNNSRRVTTWQSNEPDVVCVGGLRRGAGIYDSFSKTFHLLCICYCWGFLWNRNGIKGQTWELSVKEPQTTWWKLSLWNCAEIPQCVRLPCRLKDRPIERGERRVIYCVLDRGLALPGLDPAERNKLGISSEKII